MRLNFEHYDKIARLAARGGSFAVAFLGYIAVRVRAGGNIERKRGCFALITLAAARRALLYDYLTRTAAGVARTLLNGTENAVARDVLNCSRAVAFFALLIRRAVFCARGPAIGARFYSVIGNRVSAALRYHRRRF